MVYDLVIRGGSVVDGTGAPPRTADVAVQDGLVVEVGKLGVGTTARRTVDADGSPPRASRPVRSASAPPGR